MRIIVTGGRKYDNYDRIYKALAEFEGQDVTIVHGGCKTWIAKELRHVGADYHAGCAARALGFKVEEHPADWKLGRGAGPKRNEEMCKAGADWCFAFPGGKGTENCVFLAKRHRIPIVAYSNER